MNDFTAPMDPATARLMEALRDWLIVRDIPRDQWFLFSLHVRIAGDALQATNMEATPA